MEGFGFLTILIGLIGGVSVGLQTPIANAIGQKVGSASSSLFIHLSGTVFSLIALIIYRGENIQNWRELPWWTYFVGLFGVILYFSINFTIPRIGTTAAISLIIIGQLVTGIVIDHFGLLANTIQPIDGGRVLGILLLVLGSYLVIR